MIEIEQFIERRNKAMVQKDIEFLSAMMDDELLLVHSDGRLQSKTDWLNEIENGQLRYFDIKTENLQITVNGDRAKATCVSILDANAYGAVGTFRLNVEMYLKRTPHGWLWCNPQN